MGSFISREKLDVKPEPLQHMFPHSRLRKSFRKQSFLRKLDKDILPWKIFPIKQRENGSIIPIPLDSQWSSFNNHCPYWVYLSTQTVKSHIKKHLNLP